MISNRRKIREIFDSSSLDLSDEQQIRMYKEKIVDKSKAMSRTIAPTHKLIWHNTLLVDQIVSETCYKVEKKWQAIYLADKNGSAFVYIKKMIINNCINFGSTYLRRKELLRENMCNDRLLQLLKSVSPSGEVENFIFEDWFKQLIKAFDERETDILTAYLEQDPLDVDRLMVKWDCSKSTIYSILAKAKEKVETLLGH